MGSGVRQRGLFTDCRETEQRLGEAVQDRRTVPSNTEYITKPRRVCAERNEDVDGSSNNAVEAVVSKSEAGKLFTVGDESDLGSSLPQEKMRQMTHTRRQLLGAYLKTGSPTEAAKMVGVRNVKHVSKLITKIARHLGFRTATEMKQAAGVKAQFRQTAKHSQLMQLLKQQEFRCALSGEPLSPTTARLDHKIAVSRGGSHQLSNLQWVTDEVNRAKGTMNNEEFVALCEGVAIWMRQ